MSDNLPAEPTSRESLEQRVKRIAKVMGDAGYCSYLAIEEILRPEFDDVAKSAKDEALE